MGNVLLQLVPLMLAAMAMPTWVLLVLFLLRATDKPTDALAFVGGVTSVRLVQGSVFGLFLTAAIGPRRPSERLAFTSALLLVTGVLMWAAALREWGKAVDPVDTPSHSSRWAIMVHSITPAKAFGIGALLVAASSRAWLFTLAAIGFIGQAAHPSVESLISLLLYVLGAELLLLAPIVLSVRSPTRFDTAAGWLEAHERSIVIAVSLVLGSFFVLVGMYGLVG